MTGTGESMVAFKCDCGFEVKAPVSTALPIIQAHDADPDCPLARTTGGGA